MRLSFMCILWTLAFGLLLVRTAFHDRPDLAFLAGWALLFGMAAMVTTGYHLLVMERRHCEAIALAAATLALQHQNGPTAVD